jgi:hypothetical protein
MNSVRNRQPFFYPTQIQKLIAAPFSESGGNPSDYDVCKTLHNLWINSGRKIGCGLILPGSQYIDFSPMSCTQLPPPTKWLISVEIHCLSTTLTLDNK